MNWLKKFSIVFFSFLPLSAGAMAPVLFGTLAGIGGIVGFSIFRSTAPVDFANAYKFFSSCWTCQMFSDVMSSMSTLIPRAYSAIGDVVIPISIALCFLWIAWRIFSGFINASIDDGWTMTSTFGTQILKTVFVCALLALPLPRMIGEIVVTPVYNVGLAINRVVGDTVGDQRMTSCVVATALADASLADANAVKNGAFPPHLRHSLACQVAQVHQMTGLGMAVGWTLMNMAFDSDYMHKLMWNVPIFPNVPMAIGGLAIMVLFFFALLPIPIFFLEMFITLSLDFVMLPLMLMSALFSDWRIFPAGGRNIREMIDDLIRGTVGVALTGVFVTFAVMFINAVFGNMNGMSRIATAISTGDSKMLIDGLMMRNDSLVGIIFMGLFIAMFMNMIPALIKTLFNVSISDKFYQTTKKNLDTLWQNAKKFNNFLKK